MRKIKIFQKKVFGFKKSRNAGKPKKRPFRLIKRFLGRQLQKNPRGTFDRIQKFSEKSRVVTKKPKGELFGLPSTFGNIEKLLV